MTHITSGPPVEQPLVISALCLDLPLCLYVTKEFHFVSFLLQSIFTPLSEYLLGWKEIENSIAFCLIAFEVRMYFCQFLDSLEVLLGLDKKSSFCRLLILLSKLKKFGI